MCCKYCCYSYAQYDCSLAIVSTMFALVATLLLLFLLLSLSKLSVAALFKFMFP